MKMPLPLSAVEIDLLLGCARTDFTDEHAERVRQLVAAGPDWEPMMLYAEAHSLASLLYVNLGKSACSGVPAWAWDRLLKVLHRTEYRNQLYRGTLLQVLDKLETGGIPVMVLKGLALVKPIYGSLTLRPVIDINLLVPGACFVAAQEALLGEGFVVAPWSRTRFYQDLHSQCELRRPEPFRTSILLQRHPVNRPSLNALDLDRFWQEARQIQMFERTVRVPSPMDFLLYLCQQPVKHGFVNDAAFPQEAPEEFVLKEWTGNRLIRFVDLAEAIRHFDTSINWRTLVERARSEGLAEATRLSLAWTHRLLGSGMDPEVLNELPGPRARLARVALFHALNPPGIVQRIWMRQPANWRRAWIRLVDFQEFAFPSEAEIARREGSLSKPLAAGRYAIRSMHWMLRGAGALAISTYRKLLYAGLVPLWRFFRTIASPRRWLTYIGQSRS